MRSEIPSLLYGVKNTDITDFVYKLHALAGDYLRDAENNLRTLSNEDCADFAVLMCDQFIRLEDAAFAYQRGMDLNQSLFTSEYHNERAFLLHVEHREIGRAYGDVLLMDCATLRRDVEGHALSPIGITAVDKDGATHNISFQQWKAMDLGAKESLQNWKYQYLLTDEKAAMDNLCHRFFKQWQDKADYMLPVDILPRLNLDYMLEADHFAEDMYRIPREIAKQMLLYNDGEVYRLLPGGPERVPAIEAIKNGVWYDTNQVFAIAPKDWKGLDRACKRQTERIIGRVLKHAVSEKPRPTQER